MLVVQLAFHLKGESRSVVPQLNSDVEVECADIIGVYNIYAHIKSQEVLLPSVVDSAG